MASPYLGRADADALFRFKPVWKWYEGARFHGCASQALNQSIFPPTFFMLATLK